MKLFAGSFFYRKKYYMRIMLSVSFVAVLLVGALTLSLYIYGKQTLFRIESQNNNKILNQVRFNIELMDSTVQNIAKYLFVNPDTTAILNATDNLGADEIYNRLNRVTSSVISSNSFIHSIGFYNDYHSQYYYAGKQMYYDDAGMKRMIGDYPNVPRMKPVFRSIDNTFGNKVVKETVITYLLYQASGDPAKIDSAVAINVNSDWIVNNIHEINMVNDQAGESAYIYSDTSGFLDNGHKSDALRQSLLNEYLDRQRQQQEDSGSFERKLDQRSYVITYLRLSNQGLTIFKIQPTDLVYSYLHAYLIYLLTIFAVFVLVALLFSIMASGIVYNPIQRLVSQVSANAGVRHTRDEISFLSNAYHDTLSMIQKYDSQKQNVNAVMRSYFLKSMLTGELRVTKAGFEEACREHAMNFRYDSSYELLLIKIDDLALFQQRYNLQDRSLMKYAIANIFKETMLEFGKAEEAALNDDDIVILLPFHGEQPDRTALIGQTREAQSFIRRYCGISATVTVGDPVRHVHHLPDAYRAAVKCSAYRLLFGKGAVITTESLSPNNANRSGSHSKKLETALLENIEAANMPGIEQSLKLIRQELGGMQYEPIMTSLLHLVHAVRNRLNDAGKPGSSDDGTDLLDMLKSLGTYETLDEMFEKLRSVLHALLIGSKGGEPTNSNQIVIETVHEIIHLSYPDNGLCLDRIATTLNIPPRRLAKMFKDGTGISIGDCITEVRLKKAAQLLESTQLSVYDVLCKVGYENESYFYKLFKSRYGMTPKEYAGKFNVS